MTQGAYTSKHLNPSALAAGPERAADGTPVAPIPWPASASWDVPVLPRTIVASLLAAAITVWGPSRLARADEQYPYPYPPPLVYPSVIVRGGELRILVEPRYAQVFVDGYYSGIADNYAGLFHRLHVPPGDHKIALYIEGYRTVSQRLSVTPGATYKLHYSMEKLAPGGVSEPPTPPANAAPAQGPPGPAPRPFPLSPPPQPPQPASTSNFGTLVIRVQPAAAEILIDGDHWNGPVDEERLLIQVAEGLHRVEIFKDGYQRFSKEVEIRRGETMPLNVSLPPNKR